MSSLYTLIITQPLVNVLVFFYNTIAFHDLGIAIILLTIFVRLILYPLFKKGAHYQAVMQKIQPHLKEAQETHKKDQQKQLEATMAIYKEHGVNPFSGFVILLLQLPILIGLYNIFLRHLSLEGFKGLLYSFIATPETLHTTLLGLINLQNPSILMVGLAAFLQYFQIKLTLSLGNKNPTSDAERMARRMSYIGPLLTLFIFIKLPAAISLYWVVTSLAGVLQQYVVNKQITHGVA